MGSKSDEFTVCSGNYTGLTPHNHLLPISTVGLNRYRGNGGHCYCASLFQAYSQLHFYSLAYRHTMTRLFFVPLPIQPL
jgi:hypothetical protein